MVEQPTRSFSLRYATADRLAMRTTSRSLFDLAPDGVYLAPDIAIGAGGLLHHRFTFIPKFKYRESLLSAALSISQVKLGLLPLGGILPCGVRTFLPNIVKAITRPAPLSKNQSTVDEQSEFTL